MAQQSEWEKERKKEKALPSKLSKSFLPAQIYTSDTVTERNWDYEMSKMLHLYIFPLVQRIS